MDCSLPGSCVHGIFQARVLEWVAISFFRGSSWQESNPGLLHCRGILYQLSYEGSTVLPYRWIFRAMRLDKINKGVSVERGHWRIYHLTFGEKEQAMKGFWGRAASEIDGKSESIWCPWSQAKKEFPRRASDQMLPTQQKRAENWPLGLQHGRCLVNLTWIVSGESLGRKFGQSGFKREMRSFGTSRCIAVP